MFSDSDGAHVISVDGVGKRYRVYRRPVDRLLESLGMARNLASERWVLNNIEFSVSRGETLAIIGRNGAGKSSLLKVLCGTLAPTVGKVTVKGRVAALLELGTGFNPDFTGRENVLLNAAVHGLSRPQTLARMQEIEAFAGLGEQFDRPLRTYSSGMVVRLAFTVLAHVDADILIIDEALAVGDAVFVQRCMRFLRTFREKGTLLFVSHDMGSVLALCDRAIWLHDGSVVAAGSAKEVGEAYLEHVRMQDVSDSLGPGGLEQAAEKIQGGRGEAQPASDQGYKDRMYGASGARVDRVRLLDPSTGNEHPVIFGGEACELVVHVTVLRDLSEPIVGFFFKDRLGQNLFGENTLAAGESLPVCSGDELIARFAFRMPTLISGDYLIDVAVASGTQENHIVECWWHDACHVQARTNGTHRGLVGLPVDVHLERGDSTCENRATG
jgi:lipopolysaccharide transport system ATP-binding protein